ncbi:MAG TPA: hypothetical protein VGF40_19940 [Thermoanaerobaculia bacterium]
MDSKALSLGLAPLVATIVVALPLALAATPRERFVEIPLRDWAVPPYTANADAGLIIPMTDISGRGAFVAVAPCRLIDTRLAAGAFGGPKLAAATARSFLIPSGPCPGIPSAAAYSVNITVAQPEANFGFITAYPSGTTRPLVSNLNFNANEIQGNSAIVPASGAGSIDIYTNVATHLIVDINGYMIEPLITSLVAGTGLTGGGSSGTVSLGVANGGIGATQLGASAVTSGAIADAAITTAKIADGAVTEAKIADGAVTDAKLGTITSSGKVANSATTASSANVANAIVQRDVSGGFAAGALSLGGQLTSTVPRGTPPFVVTSTAKVTNLHADLLDGLDAASFLTTGGGTLTGALNLPLNGLRVGTDQIATANGYVGVGTVSPIAKIHAVQTASAPAVRGDNTWAASANGVGVFGRSVNAPGFGYGGRFEGGVAGVFGVGEGGTATSSSYGVWASATGSAGYRYALFGAANVSSGTTKAYGVYGSAIGAATNYAGYFWGDVEVAGTLSKSGGSFRIDHPLDPPNKYLQHSFVESPDMMNVYNGNVILDEKGEATVTLPEWFDALNRDFRYQLTPIGAPGPNLFVAEEIAANQFKIGGGIPGGKVSWQVTGIREDAWANTNRIPVELEKQDDERGLYLHPEAFGLPGDMAIERAREPLERNEPATTRQ